MQMGPLGEVHVHLVRPAPAPRFHPRLRSPLRLQRLVCCSSSFGLGLFSEAYWRMPGEQRADNGDSCCHEFGSRQLCICLRQSSAKSRLLRPLAGASSPEFLRPTLRVVTLRPYVMKLVVDTDNLVDGQPQRPKSLRREASDSFDNMFSPTSRIMRAAMRKKQRERRNDPVSFITINCADVYAGVRSTLGFSVTAKASRGLEAESFVASSFSATKLSLEG